MMFSAERSWLAMLVASQFRHVDAAGSCFH